MSIQLVVVLGRKTCCVLTMDALRRIGSKMKQLAMDMSDAEMYGEREGERE